MWMQSVWISETFGLGVIDALGHIQSSSVMLGNHDRFEAAVAIAGNFGPNRDAIGDDPLTVGAVALVDLTEQLGLARRVAQTQIYFGSHPAFDDCLVEREHQVLHLGRRHRLVDQLLQQFLRQFRQRLEGRCLGCYRSSFLLHLHIHDFYLP
ncbi:hypothetical protein WI99_04315 [Burkholderia cepacia]|nr:hypothetical protein WI99_04315 [Burkholderia cepacia]